MNKITRRRTLTAALALTLATLACLTAAPDNSVPPTARFVTVTPGGRVSLSLRTPTQTIPAPYGQQTTPIGPIATGTAFAATAYAQTATALVPTPTVAGIFSQPALCPVEGTPSLPADSPPFSRYAETIVTYLSQGGAPTILEARLRAWGALTSFGGLVRADRDFTGDGVPEVLIVALDPSQNEFPYPGNLFIFGCQDGAYRLLYQSGSEPDRSYPILISADDINGDYLNDLVYLVENCGGPVCYTNLYIQTWRLALGNFASLLEQDFSELGAEVQIVDPNHDGKADVIITSGDSSPAAGPQRVTTTTLSWNGSAFAVAHVDVAPAEYRIHIIYDADDAFRQQDYATANNYYQQAIDDNTLKNWGGPDEALALMAYARFRLVVLQATQGNVNAAQRAYNALLEQFFGPIVTATPEPTQEPPAEGETPTPTPVPTETPIPTLSPLLPVPGSGFLEMGRIFWSEYALNRNVVTACQVVIGYAQANPAAYNILNSFGYANRTYSAEDLCPPGAP